MMKPFKFAIAKLDLLGLFSVPSWYYNK